jgi:LPS-assembly lipoprotein
MLLSEINPGPLSRLLMAAFALIILTTLSACQFRPLHGSGSLDGVDFTKLSSVTVSRVDSRVGQQVRNNLLFLLNGGTVGNATHEARLSVTWFNKQLSAVPTTAGVGDTTAGTVTVIARYELIDNTTGKPITSGTRQANASYDRTGQVFANSRAERDAENRAAREVAESLRLAIASDLNR